MAIAQAGWLVDGTTYTFEEALQIAKSEGSFFTWPAVALKRLADDGRDPTVFSPSGALNCPRQRFLMAHHDYYVDPEKRWAAGVGTAIHSWLEDDDGISEVRLSLDIDGVTLSGRIDHYNPETKTLTDYKTVSSFDYWDPTEKRRRRITQAKPEHVLQVNLYALLLNHHGYEVENIRIFYVRTDKSATRLMAEVEVWDFRDTLEIATELSQPIRDALATGQLPPRYAENDENAWRCKFCPVANICAQLAERGQ